MKFVANDFSTELPTNWEDRTMITLVAPFETGNFASNLVITKHFVEASVSVEDFAAEQLQLLQVSLPAFELLDRRTTTIRHYPAYQQLHRFQSENGVLQQVQTFLRAESVIFVITGTARIEEFDRHIGAFRQIVENFQTTENI